MQTRDSVEDVVDAEDKNLVHDGAMEFVPGPFESARGTSPRGAGREVDTTASDALYRSC